MKGCTGRGAQERINAINAEENRLEENVRMRFMKDFAARALSTSSRSGRTSITRGDTETHTSLFKCGGGQPYPALRQYSHTTQQCRVAHGVSCHRISSPYYAEQQSIYDTKVLDTLLFTATLRLGSSRALFSSFRPTQQHEQFPAQNHHGRQYRASVLWKPVMLGTGWNISRGCITHHVPIKHK